MARQKEAAVPAMATEASKTRSLEIAFAVNEENLKQLETLFLEIGDSLEYRIKFSDGHTLQFHSIEQVLQLQNSRSRSIVSLIAGVNGRGKQSAYVVLKEKIAQTNALFAENASSPTVEYTISGTQKNVIYWGDKFDEWVLGIRQWYSVIHGGISGLLFGIGAIAAPIFLWNNASPHLFSQTFLKSYSWIEPTTIVALWTGEYWLFKLFPRATFSIGHGKKRDELFRFIRTGVLLAFVLSLLASVLIRSAPHRYKVYEIPKRKQGQFRTIAQPAKEVKALQYWVMENVLAQFPVHAAATAYRKGKNIADNARPHRRGNFLLKLDFTDFFPSLKARDLQRYFKKRLKNFEDGDIDALTRILFWKPKGQRKLTLSIGAPSSPLVSNMLLYDFDQRVALFCAKKGIAYTRYADDLSFSAETSSDLRTVEQFVLLLCQRTVSPKLFLNTDKLVRVSKKSSRRITSLVITNDHKVSLGRDRKREIRASVHHFVTGKLTEQESYKLKGLLAYVKSVEPSFLTRLTRKYGLDTIRRIQKFR